MKYLLSFLLLVSSIANAGNIIGPTLITSKLSISTGVGVSPTIILNGTTGEISGESLSILTGPSTIIGGLTVDGIPFPDQEVGSASSPTFVDLVINALTVGAFATLNDGLGVFTPNTEDNAPNVSFSSGAGGTLTFNAGGTLTISGSIVSGSSISAHKFLGSGTSPAITEGAGAGIGGTAVIDVDRSTDACGVVEVTAGTTPTAGATIFTATFASSYPVAPIVIASYENQNAANVRLSTTSSTTGFTVRSAVASEGLASGVSQITYHVIGKNP